MFKKYVNFLFVFIIMLSVVSCSNKNTLESNMINYDTGSKVLMEYLTAYKNKDIEKMASTSVDTGVNDLNEYKQKIGVALKNADSSKTLTNFKILDKKDESNSKYLVLYANLEWENGEVEEVKFKIMLKDNKPMVYLKEFNDTNTNF